MKIYILLYIYERLLFDDKHWVETLFIPVYETAEFIQQYSIIGLLFISQRNSTHKLLLAKSNKCLVDY